MDFENLPTELQEKAKACTTVEELAALAAAEGIELSDEALEGVAGGRPSCAKNVIFLASSDCRKNTTPSPVC